VCSPHSHQNRKGLPNLAFRNSNITEDLLKYLTQRHNKLPSEAESPFKVPVTTGLIILLRATSHGDDSNVIQAVREIDTFCWTSKLLYDKMYSTLKRLKDSKERARIMDSKYRIILLRATSHGEDSSVIRAVNEIDTFCWTPSSSSCVRLSRSKILFHAYIPSSSTSVFQTKKNMQMNLTFVLTSLQEKDFPAFPYYNIKRESMKYLILRLA